METFAHRSFNWWPHRVGVRRLIAALVLCYLFAAELRADIPWPDVTRRVAKENDALARRPQGHAREYFVVCTLYYTPMESGFTAERSFDATPVTKPGLHGRTYPRDFLQSVKKEGFGRLSNPVNGHNYIRYNGGNSYSFSGTPTGGGGVLIPRFSAAARLGSGLPRRAMIEVNSPSVREIFGSTRWKLIDTGGGLRRWQIDLYWGEDEPLGPGRLMARPRGTEFEYAYSVVKVNY